MKSALKNLNTKFDLKKPCLKMLNLFKWLYLRDFKIVFINSIILFWWNTYRIQKNKNLKSINKDIHRNIGKNIILRYIAEKKIHILLKNNGLKQLKSFKKLPIKNINYIKK